MGGGIKSFIAGLLFARAGADEPSPNQLVLLRDEHQDGVAEKRFVLREGLNSPGGIAWADGKLMSAIPTRCCASITILAPPAFAATRTD